jgi:membrane protease YdiL (CAAX protease family)
MTARSLSAARTSSAIAVFVAIAYALSMALSVVIGLTGGHESSLFGLRFLAMAIPAVAVLIAASVMNEPLRIDWSRLSLRYVPLALLLFPIVLHVAMVPVTVAYEGRLPWADWLAPQADGLYHSPPERGWGALTLGGLLVRLALNALVGLIVVSVMALFEEVGWRAWLQPRLARRLGVRRGIVVTSLIWAVWHIPFYLSGIQHIDGVSPQQLVLVAPLGTFASGLILGWLWARTESIWIVSLAHGALNSLGQYAFKYMNFVIAPDIRVLRAGTVGLLAVGILLLMWGIRSTEQQQHP